MQKDTIAIVGAGKGGTAILETLINIKKVEIFCIYDINEDAPGFIIAQKYGICHSTDKKYSSLINNDKVNLILEVTGKKEVIDILKKIKHPNTSLVGASGTKIIFHFLEAQQKVTKSLEDYKNNLEFLINERTEQLELANVALQKQIYEKEELVEKLHQINNEKTKYLLQATHQLKAPFAAIQSYVDIILNGYTGEITEKTQSIMEKIKVRCEMLAMSIKEMLELSNLKSCLPANLKKEDISINDLLKEVIDSVSIVAQEAKVTIDFNPIETSSIITCAKEQVKILFSILLENAVNYSKLNSKITVNINQLTKTRLVVEISDQGIGIPEENLDKIFKEYFRSNNAVKKHENGSGLGLAIAKQIATIHNYIIEVNSKLEEGTTVSIYIPVKS